MEFTYKSAKMTLIASVNQELDHHKAVTIRSEIDREMIRTKAKHLVFDFSSLEFMDSSGIGVVIGRYKNISKSGGKVVIVNNNPLIKRILEISGIGRIITPFKSVDEALKAI